MNTDKLPDPTPYPYTTATEARVRILEEQIQVQSKAITALFEVVKALSAQVDELRHRTVAAGGLPL